MDNWLTDRTIDLLKTEMDGIGRSSGVTTILTTNFPERLPEALIDRPGRFHDVLKFDLPTAAERKRMLSKWIDGITPQELTQAVNKTDGYSGAHLYELANFAKTIKDEDSISLSTALTKALEKIAEQRALIDNAQLEGSHYRPRKSIAPLVKFWAQSGVPKADKAADKSMCKCPKCGYTAPMGDFGMDEVGADGESKFVAVLVKDANRMRAFRDRLSLVLDAHQPEERPGDSVLEVLGLAAPATP